MLFLLAKIVLVALVVAGIGIEQHAGLRDGGHAADRHPFGPKVRIQ